MKIDANGLAFEVLVHEPPPGVEVAGTVLLTMGLGMQLVAWPDSFIQALTQAGQRVVRYDNRDIGLSSHLDALGAPRMPWQFVKHKMGWPLNPPYTLQDMALDALGLLDALGIDRAHLVGISMGGMVSQRLAATAPHRVRSLTSIMSSSGAPGLPGPSAQVARAMLIRPFSRDPADIVSHTMSLFRLIGSPAFRDDADQLRARILAGVLRSYHPQGVLRQTLAIVADTDRHTLLPRIGCPTLVIHGTADPLVPLACGQDTARRIPGALLEAIDGMGHDWPPSVQPLWLRVLLPHLAAAR
jgi:pimeloyl-ACP methyl ester carboxylesterase